MDLGTMRGGRCPSYFRGALGMQVGAEVAAQREGLQLLRMLYV